MILITDKERHNYFILMGKRWRKFNIITQLSFSPSIHNNKIHSTLYRIVFFLYDFSVKL